MPKSNQSQLSYLLPIFWILGTNEVFISKLADIELKLDSIIAGRTLQAQVHTEASQYQLSKDMLTQFDFPLNEIEQLTGGTS